MFELSAEDRRRAILESIACFLGDKALDPEVYYESDWGSEEWTRGAYAASYDLGGLHRYGKDQHDAGRSDLLVLLRPRGRGLPARRRRRPDGADHGGPDRRRRGPRVRRLIADVRAIRQQFREDGQMRYVVGYSANARGHDAVNLAVSLALGRGASLDLVLVVPEVQQFGAAHAPKAGFETLLNEQAQEWLDAGIGAGSARCPGARPISAALIPTPMR